MKSIVKMLFTNPLFWLAIAVLGFSSAAFFYSPKAAGSSKQTVKVEVAKKPAEIPQGTETELREKMLDPAGDIEARLGAAKGWAKEHVSNAEKECAAYKKKVYSSNVDPQLKDLLWGAAVTASEYCWEVDIPPAPKVIKPKQKK